MVVLVIFNICKLFSYHGQTVRNMSITFFEVHARLQGLRDMRRWWISVTSVLMALVIVGAARVQAAERFPALIDLPAGWLPEGVVTGRSPIIYSGSRANGAIYAADLRTGEGSILVPGQTGRIAVESDRLAPDVRAVAGLRAGVTLPRWPRGHKQTSGSAAPQLADYQSQLRQPPSPSPSPLPQVPLLLLGIACLTQITMMQSAPKPSISIASESPRGISNQSQDEGGHECECGAAFGYSCGSLSMTFLC